MDFPIIEISLPEYNLKSEPDHSFIGKKVDNVILTYFEGEEVAIRCISSTEHERLSLDELLGIISDLGTDRYDKNRKGDRYENVEKKKIDFFALPFKVVEGTEIFRQFTFPFYHYPIENNSHPIRIDIMIIYSMAHLEQVYHKYEGRDDVKSDGFRFLDQKNKRQAIKGIIKIL